MKIRNVKGSSKVSGRPPQPYSSWLNYWEIKANFSLDRNQLYNCPACGKAFYPKDFDGCHVQKASFFDWTWFIVPLCSSCNHSTEIMEIDNDVCMVSSPSNLFEVYFPINYRLAVIGGEEGLDLGFGIEGLAT